MATAVALRPRLGARAERLLPRAACGAALSVAAVGLIVIAFGGDLGTPTPPFMIAWRPRVDVHAWVTALVVAGALAGLPVLVARVRSPLLFAASLYAVTLVLGLGVNLAHEGVRGWWAVFATGSHGSFEGHFEYLPGRPLLRSGVGWYVGHFAALFPYMTTHIKGNPPGPLILMRWLGISDAGGLAALCVVAGSACAPLAYGIGRVLGGDPRGRLAGVLCACSPAALLFGVSSFDYVFAAVGALAVWLLLLSDGRRVGVLALGAVTATLATFLSWLLFAIPAWAAVVVLRRSGWRGAAAVVGACASGVVLLNGALWVVWGYDPFATLRVLGHAYAHGAAAGRPYAFWVFGSPAAWMVMLGLPIAWLSLKALVRGDAAAVALWLMIAGAAVIGVTKAETERIWLPFVPLACAAAAAGLPSTLRLRPVLALLLAQAVIVEVLFFTVW